MGALDDHNKLYTRVVFLILIIILCVFLADYLF